MAEPVMIAVDSSQVAYVAGLAGPGLITTDGSANTNTGTAPFIAAFDTMQVNGSKLKWPSTIEKAAKRIDITIDRAQRYAICPTEGCGAIYLIPLDGSASEYEAFKCTRFIQVPVEVP